MNHYQEKNQNYFTNARHDLISFLSGKKNIAVLEAGAGGGSTLVTLKESGIASEVAGIELFKLENTLQDDPRIDKFIIANLEHDKIDLPEEHFDAVLCGDILEHLLDPWSAVDKLAKHLKPGGLIIASIPNIRVFSALRKIYFRGDFSYEKQGLFDRTHYRWFCKKNMIDLLTGKDRKLVSTTSNLEFKKGSGTRRFNRLSGRIFEEFLTVQFIIVVQKV